MSVTARMNSTWALKWTIMALVMLGWGGACIYDAKVSYPAHDLRAKKAQDFKHQVRNTAEVAEAEQWVWKNDDSPKQWAQYAKSQGWSEADPGPPNPPKNYTTQWVQLAICWPLGLVALVMVGLTSRQRLEADEEGVTGPRGRKVPYSAIQSIDKARWDSKGIAILHWEDAGRSGTLKIDDWVFRDGDKVLEEVEKHTGLGEAVAG